MGLVVLIDELSEDLFIESIDFLFDLDHLLDLDLFGSFGLLDGLNVVADFLLVLLNIDLDNWSFRSKNDGFHSLNFQVDNSHFLGLLVVADLNTLGGQLSLSLDVVDDAASLNG